MVSRENRVILGSVALLVLAIAGGAALERVLGVAVLEQPLVVFVLLYGLPIVVPQLYLAATGDEDASPRARIWLAAIVTALFAFALTDGTDVQWSTAFDDLETFQYALIAGLGAAALAGALGYEILVSSRSRGDVPTR